MNEKRARGLPDAFSVVSVLVIAAALDLVKGGKDLFERQVLPAHRFLDGAVVGALDVFLSACRVPGCRRRLVWRLLSPRGPRRP